MLREVFAQANKAEIGPIGFTVSVSPGEHFHTGQSGSEVKAELDQA